MIGTPFHHLGRVPHVGVDCVGLLHCSLTSIGERVPSLGIYPDVPTWDRIHPRLGELCEHRDRVEVGLFCAVRIGKRICHLGIVSDRGLVHTVRTYGVVLASIDTWSPFLASCWEWRWQR
jgi:hypothetical protein